ncbi:MAG: O-methyltransferase [Lachnospiraceae bacterium]|nr:O-methyltransferase [Lachnospiraceae bacterium]
MDEIRVSSFIKSLYKDDEGVLGEIYKKALREGVPVIRTDTREYIKHELLMKKPMRLLEIGTAIGYSSLYMSLFLDSDARIKTVELDEDRYMQACENIRLMGKENVISPIHGDAFDIIKGLEDNMYDMIFLDGPKGQYINYLPELIRVIKNEGIIISDNVLQEGEILESHFAVEKRNRTIHDKMREYLYKLTHEDGLHTVVIPVGDGLAVTYVIKN